MEKALDYVSDLKLRASWGQIGKQNIGNYGYYSTMQPVGNSNYWLKDGEFITYISTPVWYQFLHMGNRRNLGYRF
ncbi:MAG: hypothetical protein ACLUVG_07720 [Phocaeicola vulgatus]